ncbi:MAG: hypothetical protein JXA93_24085 [Anaerolineae bacterium]|nr:hypothetical protein [Anaerolineae bacterium]
MQNQQIMAIVVGAIAGLLPIVLTTLISWMDRRTRLSKQTQALNLAQKRVEFLSGWLKAQELLCSPQEWEQLKRSASEELVALRQHLTDILEEEQRRPIEVAEERSPVQKLFLLYRPRTASGWILHTLFYMFASITTLYVIYMLWPMEGWSWTFDAFVESAIVTLVGVTIALFFRRLAVAADRRAEQQLALWLAAKTGEEEFAGTGQIAGP